jgi:peptidoglycan/LPS O-acetylase OafA/YrhL
VFGAWRLVLALFVVGGHFSDLWWPAGFAVMSFYVISGYLMTLVLDRTYAYSASGFRGFWINRALRLYPSYYFAVAFACLLLLLIPNDFILGWNPKLRVPTTAFEIFSNVTMWGLIHVPGTARVIDIPLIGAVAIPSSYAALVPPAWALFTELIHYLLISLGFGRSLRTATLMFALGAVYLTAVIVAFDGNFYWRYFFPLAGTLPFGLGAMTYHVLKRERVRSFISARPRAFLVGTGAVYCLPFVTGLIQHRTGSGDPLTYLIYVNVGLTALVVAALAAIRTSKPIRAVDSWLGDLSYPVYLWHWQVGILVAWLLNATVSSTLILALTAAGSVLFAIADRYLVSSPVARLRDRVREGVAPAVLRA